MWMATISKDYCKGRFLEQANAKWIVIRALPRPPMLYALRSATPSTGLFFKLL
jgi:hypothetical protein